MDGLDGSMPRNKGERLRPVTRKAHPWVDSRPSEDQAAFAGRGRSDEGLALGLSSLSDPLRGAHPPPALVSVAPPERVASALAVWELVDGFTTSSHPVLKWVIRRRTVSEMIRPPSRRRPRGLSLAGRP